MSGPSDNWRKPRIGYEALDNGFRSCQNPVALQKVCDQLGPGAVKNFFWRWLHRLPSPFTPAELKAGYVYQLAFRQFEISDTCVFDRPPAGRMWFEGVIRDHLDVGRPDQVMLIFNRRLCRSTPGPFRTRVLTEGVDPTLTCYYKSSRLKQYFKEGRAWRTETVICDTRDFGIGRQVCAKNWYALQVLANRPTGGCVTPKPQTRCPPPIGGPSTKSPNRRNPTMVSTARVFASETRE
jgi:hypothetical protein